MKKTTINISFDEEKTAALKLYLEQKNSTIEKEMENCIETIYTKVVPSNVREFIDMRTGTAIKPQKKKAVNTQQIQRESEES